MPLFVIPIAWQIGVAVVSAASAYFVNENAKEKEQEAHDLHSKAKRAHKEATEALVADRDALQTKLVACQADVQQRYEEFASRARPILDHYGQPLKRLGELTMPPGFDQIEGMAIPALPSEKILLAIGDHVWRERLSEAAGRAMWVGGHSGMSTGASGLQMPNLPNAAFMGALAALNQATNRNTAANELLTEATKSKAKADEFVVEAAKLKEGFAQLRRRADAVSNKLGKTAPFFERYIGPCHALWTSGKSWEQLDTDDHRSIGYLAYLMASITTIAQEPLA